MRYSIGSQTSHTSPAVQRDEVVVDAGAAVVAWAVHAAVHEAAEVAEAAVAADVGVARCGGGGAVA